MVCACEHIHLEYLASTAHLTCKPCMHSDVDSSLNSVCECAMYTWDCELEQCASLVNHACIMMSVVV